MLNVLSLTGVYSQLRRGSFVGVHNADFTNGIHLRCRMTSEFIADFESSIVDHHQNDGTLIFMVPRVHNDSTERSTQVAFWSAGV